MGLIVTTTFGAAKHGRASRIKDASTGAGQETRANKTLEKTVMARAACDHQCNDTSLHVAPNSAINGLATSLGPRHRLPLTEALEQNSGQFAMSPKARATP